MSLCQHVIISTCHHGSLTLFDLASFLDALASLDFTLVSESVIHSFEFKTDLKSKSFKFKIDLKCKK
jgi:hypothetical protein